MPQVPQGKNAYNSVTYNNAYNSVTYNNAYNSVTYNNAYNSVTYNNAYNSVTYNKLVEEFYGTRYQSVSFSLIIREGVLHCLRVFSSIYFDIRQAAKNIAVKRIPREQSVVKITRQISWVRAKVSAP